MWRLFCGYVMAHGLDRPLDGPGSGSIGEAPRATIFISPLVMGVERPALVVGGARLFWCTLDRLANHDRARVDGQLVL